MKKSIKRIIAIILSIAVLFSFSACSVEDIEKIFLDLLDQALSQGDNKPTSTPTNQGEPLKTDELSIHFLTLGNKYTGDAIYIKINDVDILIDAGSKTNSATTITEYIKGYCTDGTLEYVIATHAHQDHIAAFGYTSKIKSVFDEFKCETIIDFPLTNADSTTYDKYIEMRDKEVAEGAVHYNALQCWNNEGGAKRSYELAEGVTMDILYNHYYEVETTNENNYSVCVLINQGDKHYLLTGDLEDKGEEYLVKNNNLPQCTLFKAAHHGSYTGSNDVLLDVIRPEYVVVTCVAGSDEYTKDVDNMFPSKDALKRIEKHTNKIYCTSIVADNEEEVQDYNGNVVVRCDGENLTIECSGTDKYLNESDWYKQNRA